MLQYTRFIHGWYGMKCCLLLASLMLVSCVDDQKIRNVDGHTYLRNWQGTYEHDPKCPKCDDKE